LFASATCFFAAVAHADASKIGTVTADILNVRVSPDTSAAKVTQISLGDQVVVVDSADDWYKISFGDVIGWVAGQYLDVSNGTASIIGDQVNIRASADLSGEVIVRIDRGEKVTVLGRSGDWFNIQLADATTGWVFRDFISVGGSSRGDSIGNQIVNYAKKFLGVRYVYGGNGPNSFDCSGFTRYVDANFGIYLERVASDQAAQGVKISKGALRPGDLIFFNTGGGGGYINHVGIYIGNGSMIHASSGAGRVMISDINGGFYASAYVTARRVIRD